MDMQDLTRQWSEGMRAAALDWRRDAVADGRISTDVQLAGLACIHPTTLSALLSGAREWSMTYYLRVAHVFSLSGRQAVDELAARIDGEAGP